MLTIYIADDSVEIRKRLIEMLSALEGVALVGQAAEAQTAIQEIRRLKPDAAILDIRMPGGNGIQVLEAVKGLAKPPLVIMLTAFPYEQYRRKCVKAGADYFFDKSNEFEKVVELLEELAKKGDFKQGDDLSSGGFGNPPQREVLNEMVKKRAVV
jgi:DNA-binding NarL/FixJ family response regulator